MPSSPFPPVLSPPPGARPTLIACATVVEDVLPIWSMRFEE
jgi:hypothetical protein